MAYSDGSDLRGVGGWLAFFLVTLGIITPAISLVSIAALPSEPGFAEINAMFPALMPTEWAITLFVIALCWFTVYRFVQVKNWTTVRIGIATLAILLFISIVGEPLLVSAVTGLDLGTVYGVSAPADLIRPVVYCSIWTAYLLMSKRVRNTYHPAHRGDPAEVFA